MARPSRPSVRFTPLDVPATMMLAQMTKRIDAAQAPRRRPGRARCRARTTSRWRRACGTSCWGSAVGSGQLVWPVAFVGWDQQHADFTDDRRSVGRRSRRGGHDQHAGDDLVPASVGELLAALAEEQIELRQIAIGRAGPGCRGPQGANFVAFERDLSRRLAPGQLVQIERATGVGFQLLALDRPAVDPRQIPDGSFGADRLALRHRGIEHGAGIVLFEFGGRQVQLALEVVLDGAPPVKRTSRIPSASRSGPAPWRGYRLRWLGLPSAGDGFRGRRPRRRARHARSRADPCRSGFVTMSDRGRRAPPTGSARRWCRVGADMARRGVSVPATRRRCGRDKPGAAARAREWRGGRRRPGCSPAAGRPSPRAATAWRTGSCGQWRGHSWATLGLLADVIWYARDVVPFGLIGKP